MSTRRDRINRARRVLGARLVPGRGYIYRDEGTRSEWVSSAKDLALFGALLERAARGESDPGEDAYTLWRERTKAVELP